MSTTYPQLSAQTASAATTICQEPANVDVESGAVGSSDVKDLELEAEEKTGVEGDEVEWVTWDGPDDPANPLNWSKRRKWIITWLKIIYCGLVSMAVSGYSISQSSMETELRASGILVSAGLSLFTLTFGAAPLLLAPVSEVHGRLGVYIVTSVLFTLMFIPQALAPNITAMLISRFLAGIFASTGVSLVGGTLNDIWSASERGLPMALFAWITFGSTGVAPLFGGIITQTRGFRDVFWCLFALSATFTILDCFLGRETRAPVILSRKAARLRKETGDSRHQSKGDFERSSIAVMMKTSLTRPVYMLCTEPVLIAFTVWFSFSWARAPPPMVMFRMEAYEACSQTVLYILLESTSLVFGGIYGFSLSESGYLFSAQIIAATCGLGINHYTNKMYLANVAKRGPEARLYPAMIGGIVMPLGAWLYAWTARSSIHWIVPAIGTFFIYTGMYCVYLTTFSYMADSYTFYAASAIAGLNFVRNAVMYNRLGIAGGGSLLAGLATLLALTPFVLYRYGLPLRTRSRYVQALLKMEKEGA
ncbi:Major Facilitator Superfamily protein [Pseudohyphozyma bogoriensis]|nr:Major Facilitator Superfamily protein [Pseudohyphozyma bogoriensis]